MIITITCKHTLTSVLSKNRFPENDHLVQQRHQENQAMMREGGSCRKKRGGTGGDDSGDKQRHEMGIGW